MNNNFVESLIRKLNMRTFFLSLAFLLVVIIGLAVSARYLANMALGPAPIARADLLALQDPSGLFRYYVNVEADDHADTGYTYVSTSDSGKETIEAYYHVLYLDDKVLLVKSKTEKIEDTMKGALVTIPAEIQTGVIGEIEREYKNYKGAFLPVMLDATNFYSSGYVGLALAAITGLASLWGLGLAIYRFTNPDAHPAVKALERYGSPSQLTGEIDNEMAVEHARVGKKVHFTRRWLVSTASSLDAARYQDIIWCYMQVTQHRTNGIPTGKTYAAHVGDRHGRMIIIPGKEEEVNQMLQNLVSLAPGVVAGYSDELNQMWSKDRARFAAAVDERRRAAGNPG